MVDNDGSAGVTKPALWAFAPPKSPGAKDKTAKKPIQKRAKQIARLVHPQKASFNRILGAGGMGLAVLFDVEQGLGAGTKQVVIKCDLEEKSKWGADVASLAHEKHFHQVSTEHREEEPYSSCYAAFQHLGSGAGI